MTMFWGDWYSSSLEDDDDVDDDDEDDIESFVSMFMFDSDSADILWFCPLEEIENPKQGFTVMAIHVSRKIQSTFTLLLVKNNVDEEEKWARVRTLSFILVVRCTLYFYDYFYWMYTCHLSCTMYDMYVVSTVLNIMISDLFLCTIIHHRVHCSRTMSSSGQTLTRDARKK